MINWLLRIGLVVTPFILAPGHADIAREPKMAWAVVFALAIGLTALYQGKIKPFKNRWALILVGFVLVSFYLSPNPKLNFFGVDSGRFWSWEPLYYTIVFLLMTVSVASIEQEEPDLNRTFDVMVWCGFVMGAFLLAQACHLDQFFEHRFGTYGHMAGTLGNPTLVGPFLGMIVPLAIARKRYAFAGVMVLATMATRSDVAMLGMLAMLLCYVALQSKKIFIVVALVSTVLMSGAVFAYVTQQEVKNAFPDNERFLTWGQSVNDVTSPVMKGSKKTYVVTGIGPGSFMYLFHAKNNQRNDNFLYAHNDYVQVFYEYGIVGFLLFASMLGLALKQVIPFRNIGTLDDKTRALLSGLACVSVCAAGSFVWQIGTHIFYTLTFIGLLYSATNQGGRHAC